ncbi:MAG: hypothetical protein KC431_29580, partial [Myxococcales bacterium]|nr:hypothetical protein [Myxococcales bacterium]
ASLPATWIALKKPSPRTLAGAALLLGGSVLAHPFGMLTVATSAVIWPVVCWASGAMRRELPPGVLRWGLLIHLGAGLLCVGWLYVFMASAEEMARSPVPWMPLGTLAADLLSGELFREYRAWVGPLTVIGLLVAIRRGRAMAWLGVSLVCALLVLGSEASITVLRLDLLVSGFKNLQFPRYTLALKPVLHAFAGIGAALLLARLRAVPDRDRPTEGQATSPLLRPPVARLLAAICLAPLLVGVIETKGRLLPRPVGVEVLEGSVHEEVDASLLASLRAESQGLTEDQNGLKVAFLRGGMGGGTYPLFAITDADAALVLDGHIPAVNYRHQVRDRSPEALRLMGVTHVLYDMPLSIGADKRLAEQLEELGQHGEWTLARLRPERSNGFEVHGAIDP